MMTSRYKKQKNVYLRVETRGGHMSEARNAQEGYEYEEMITCKYTNNAGGRKHQYRIVFRKI